MRTIIGIDPGTTESGYIVFTPQGILEMGKIDNALLLNMIIGSTAKPFNDFPNPEFVIEMIASYGMPVGKEVFETVLWIGRFVQQINTDFGQMPKLVYRRDIKIWHCNSSKANDGNIRQALIDKYGPVGVKKNKGFCYGVSKDMWSALAVATYWYERHDKRI